MGKNTAIFMDYDNIYLTIEKYYETSIKLNLKTDIIKKIKDTFSSDNILTIKAFADFQKVNPVLTELQKTQVELRHVYSNNSEKASRKNASDIALTIDVIKSLYSKNNIIEKYVIVSSDSDMLPIINELRFFGKEVVVIYSEYCISDNYNDCVNSSNLLTIEGLLGLSKYSPISNSQINDTVYLTAVLNLINDGIGATYKKHGKGTASKKNIYEYLAKGGNYINNDISLIIDYLFAKQILIESPIAGSAYNKVLINKSYLASKNITLTNTVIVEAMY